MKKLGFGLMRLPKVDGMIDVEQVKTMVDTFIQAGFTYFDTAYVYDQSEEAFQEAVVKRYPRKSYTIADKLPAWKINEKGDVEKIFQESLQRCGVDYFDYYLLHAILGNRSTLFEEFGAYDFCLKMKEEKKILHFGFSFHGTPELLEEILIKHPEVDFVQLQLNYLDWDNAMIASRKNYEICRKYHKQIIVMEPVKGGMLANLKPEIANIFKEHSNHSPASFALRYVASLEGVCMVLSGMSNMQQVEDNLQTFTDLQPLSLEESQLVEQVKNEILKSTVVGCTACRYCCSGCPKKINIPELFKIYNQLLNDGKVNLAKECYQNLIAKSLSNHASSCIGCGKCESVCPQHIEIIAELKKISRFFDQES